MLEPRGPLPASIYWRRRWAALAALLVVLGLIALAIVAAAGSMQQASSRTVSTAEVAAAADPRPLPSDVLSDAPTPPPSGPAPATPATASSPPAPEDERARPEPPAAAASQAPTAHGPAPAPGQPATGPPGAAAVSSAGAPPAAPAEGPCPDQVIGVGAQVGAPQYEVGERPVFRLVIVNNGQVPCRRDLDAALQELGVFTANGAKKLWSSNDCFPGQSTDVRMLRPGEPVTFTLTWSARTSAPGCRGTRAPVGPGEFRLLSRLGGIISPPTQFQLIP